jgi:hypothetical protein
VVISLNIDMTSSRDFYSILSAAGHTTSLRDYSAYYLGMAENYACLRGERGPSERALVNLFRRLWDERRFWLAAKVARAILFEMRPS